MAKITDDDLAALRKNVARGKGADIRPGMIRLDDRPITGELREKVLSNMPRRSKYGVDTSDAGKAKRTRDSILFASQREAAHYDDLKLLMAGGKIRWFIRQPSFDLPGRITYRADFLIVWDDGEVEVRDVKGYVTKTYALKVKQVKAIYGIDVQEV